MPADRVLVLNQEDCALSGSRMFRDGGGGNRTCFCVEAGEVQREGRPLAGFAADRDRPAALLDDPVDHRQAEAGSLSEFLSGEERLEDQRARALVHADAGIGDGERDVGAWPDTPVGPPMATSRSTLAVSIRIFPPSGMASRAFTTRFIRACSIYRVRGGPLPHGRGSVLAPKSRGVEIFRSLFWFAGGIILSAFRRVSCGLPLLASRYFFLPGPLSRLPANWRTRSKASKRHKPTKMLLR